MMGGPWTNHCMKCLLLYLYVSMAIVIENHYKWQRSILTSVMYVKFWNHIYELLLRDWWSYGIRYYYYYGSECKSMLAWKNIVVLLMAIKLIKCAIKTKYYKFIDIKLFHFYKRYCQKLIDITTWFNDQSVDVHIISWFSLYFCLNSVCACVC